MKRILAAILILIFSSIAAEAQTGSVKSQAALNLEIGTTGCSQPTCLYPDNIQGLITPFGLRQGLLDITATMFAGQLSALCTTPGAFPIYNSTDATWECSTSAHAGNKAILLGDAQGAQFTVGSSTPGGLIPTALFSGSGLPPYNLIEVTDGSTYSLSLNANQKTFYAQATDAGYAWFHEVGNASKGIGYAFTLNGVDTNLHVITSTTSFWDTPTLLRGPLNISPYGWVVIASDVGPASLNATGVGIKPGANTVSFTGAIASKTLTVSAISSGIVYPGQMVAGAGVLPVTTIVKQLSGAAGSTGTYEVSKSQTVGSESMTAALGVYNAALAIGWNFLGLGEVQLVSDVAGMRASASAVAFVFSEFNEATNTLTTLGAFNALSHTQTGAFTPFRGIVGVADTSSACAGCVGEYISSEVIFTSASALSAGTWTSVAQITLTAGDWTVNGNVGLCFGAGFNCGVTTDGRVAIAAASIDTTVGQPASAAQFTEFAGSGFFNSVNFPTLPAGPQRYTCTASSCNGTGTNVIHLNTYCGYVGTGTFGCAAYGKIQARRAR